MNKKTFTLLLILPLFFSCSKSDIEKRRDKCLPFYFSDTYIFPTRPGSDDWIQLNSLTKKVEACQIPDSILTSISTEGLLETLLNYPLIHDFFAYNQLQDGFVRIKTENKGFNELYNRDNLFQLMIDRYELMSLNCDGDTYPPFNVEIKTPITIPFEVYEFFFFQYELLNTITIDKRNSIFKKIYNNHILKIEKGYSSPEYLVSGAILGKIMYQNDFTPFVNYCEETEFMKYFIERIPVYRPENLKPLDIITEYAKEYNESL